MRRERASKVYTHQTQLSFVAPPTAAAKFTDEQMRMRFADVRCAMKICARGN